MPESIPFNKPFITGRELEYIAQAVDLGNIGGDGKFTHECARILEEQFEIHKVLMTPSCTAALEMAAQLCEIEPGDEVVMPSFTFVSTANAVARLGAKPVFVDIRTDTLNLDESLVEAAITPSTKAIVPVHYAGVACEMDRIIQIAESHGLKVIEDAAQAVNASYKGRALGSIGHLSGYSFHETKNYICGEGGALGINDSHLVERAEIIRDKGTNRQQFFRGQVDKYSWVDIGSSYVPSEINCAFLLAQLELLMEIADRRREIYELYSRLLGPLADDGWLRLPMIPEHVMSNYHMMYVLLPTQEIRDGLLSHLRSHDIQAVIHFVPLHSSPVGKKLGYHESDLPITEQVSRCLVRLPFYYDITETAQERVVDSIRAYVDQNKRLFRETDPGFWPFTSKHLP